MQSVHTLCLIVQLAKLALIHTYSIQHLRQPSESLDRASSLSHGRLEGETDLYCTSLGVVILIHCVAVLMKRCHDTR